MGKAAGRKKGGSSSVILIMKAYIYSRLTFHFCLFSLMTSLVGPRETGISKQHESFLLCRNIDTFPETIPTFRSADELQPVLIPMLVKCLEERKADGKTSVQLSLLGDIHCVWQRIDTFSLLATS